MIVNMKKIHLIVQKKDVPFALERLRDIGSVHVEHYEDLKGQRVDELKNKSNHYHPFRCIETLLNILLEPFL